MVMTARLSETFHSTGQLRPENVSALAQEGFTAIINNRPDDEEPGQPSAAEMRRAAEQAGLAYHHLPMTTASLSPELVAAFAEALNAAPGPVVAHCRSGARSTLLWVLVETRLKGRPVAEVMAEAAEAGYDLSPMRPLIDHCAAG